MAGSGTGSGTGSGMGSVGGFSTGSTGRPAPATRSSSSACNFSPFVSFVSSSSPFSSSSSASSFAHGSGLTFLRGVAFFDGVGRGLGFLARAAAGFLCFFAGAVVLADLDDDEVMARLGFLAPEDLAACGLRGAGTNTSTGARRLRPVLFSCCVTRRANASSDIAPTSSGAIVFVRIVVSSGSETGGATSTPSAVRGAEAAASPDDSRANDDCGSDVMARKKTRASVSRASRRSRS